jgi:hypothetical protein
VQLEDFWDEIKPLTFKEIAKIENLEMRRVAIFCLGLERLIDEVKPTLINSTTLPKKTKWVNEDGSLIEHTFEDTYELYEVDGSYFNENLATNSWQRLPTCHFVKFKDTSTDRIYMIWVDIDSVYRTNYVKDNSWIRVTDNQRKLVTSIDAISWTIQVNVEKGDIKEIFRQGDCIIVRPKPNAKIGTVRHLTSAEYRTLLVAES